MTDDELVCVFEYASMDEGAATDMMQRCMEDAEKRAFKAGYSAGYKATTTTGLQGAWEAYKANQ
jgi:hypothetical protein